MENTFHFAENSQMSAVVGCGSLCLHSPLSCHCILVAGSPLTELFPVFPCSLWTLWPCCSKVGRKNSTGGALLKRWWELALASVAAAEGCFSQSCLHSFWLVADTHRSTSKCFVGLYLIRSIREKRALASWLRTQWNKEKTIDNTLHFYSLLP